MADDGARIETARLVLRRAAPGDLDAIHAILSDPACMRYWSSAPHRSVEESRLWLDQMIAAQDSDEFVVTRDGSLIGKFGVWTAPEVGFIFARQAWGRGYATEAGEAFLAHAASRGYGSPPAVVDPRNTASTRLLTRLGFHETGRASRTLLVDGVWFDSVYLRRDLAAA